MATKAELWKRAKGAPQFRGASADFALPQDWLDAQAEAYAKAVYGDDPARRDARQYAYEQLMLGVVWVYRVGRAFGEPVPVTGVAHDILKFIEKKRKQSHG